MFIDQAKMELFGGKGGDGIVAYRRELKIEYGGPFGGNGGNGGSIIFKGSNGMSTLLDLKYNAVLKAEDGERGKHKGMYGRNAEDTIVLVPVGTTIFDQDTNKVIGDITKDGQEVVVCKGGRGGRGNMSFQSNTLKCPDFCEKGEPGEHRYIK
ncbi:MAG: GTPase ObgE, partial [Acholeplasmatales bacterium]|nr:GTPase ObgE [Acholeplasmatales bacterium]